MGTKHQIEKVFDKALNEIESEYNTAAHNGAHNACWAIGNEKKLVESLKAQVMEIVNGDEATVYSLLTFV